MKKKISDFINKQQEKKRTERDKQHAEVMMWSLADSAFLLDSWGVENQSWGKKEMVSCEHEWWELYTVRSWVIERGHNGLKGSWAEFVDLEQVERLSILSSLKITETNSDVLFLTLRKFNPKRLKLQLSLLAVDQELSLCESRVTLLQNFNSPHCLMMKELRGIYLEASGQRQDERLW
jgi:hypothetical protein